METSQVNNATTSARSPLIASSSGNTFGCLLRFALANIRRRPARFVLAVLGIALAIACVTVVRTVSSSFAITGADSVTDVLGDAQLWVVPAAGVQYDPVTQALIAGGAAPQIDVPAGWTATRTLSGRTEVGGNPMSLRGNDEIPLGQAVFGGAAADRLGIAQGDRVDIGGHDLLAAVAGAGQSVTVAIPVARDIVGDYGWWTVKAPAGQQNRRDLGKQLSAATGLASTADPSQIPDSDGDGLIYDTVGGTGPLSFEQKFSALFSGKVTSSTLGVISTIGLALGFVIAVSSFLAAVAERKREFGIMSSIGLADEVLYFFLVESALIFVTAYLVGVLGAGVAVALVVPGIATLAAWLQATGMVAVFIPAMAIVGALIPVHRLLQQRPVDLLGAR